MKAVVQAVRRVTRGYTSLSSLKRHKGRGIRLETARRLKMQRQDPMMRKYMRDRVSKQRTYAALGV